MAKKEIPPLNNPMDALKVNSAVNEIVVALQRIADQKSFIKDVQDRMEEELEFPKAELTRLANERYKDSQTDVLFKAQEIVELNERLMELGRKAANGKLVTAENTPLSATRQADEEE